MNNLELYNKFNEIALVANPFDLALKLKAFNKEYKKSEFYKSTHMSMYKAYELYNKANGAYVLNFINQVISEPSKLTELLGKAIDGLDPSYLQELTDKLLATTDISELKDLQVQLGEAANSLKNPF